MTRSRRLEITARDLVAAAWLPRPMRAIAVSFASQLDDPTELAAKPRRRLSSSASIEARPLFKAKGPGTNCPNG